MGEVYRAHDSGLKRDIAIKVLPEAFAADADRLRRFEQEALATAALNHPNIMAVYDVGTHAGRPYVVAELLDGRTLWDLLAAGPLPLKKAVDYAAQITSGLAAAHEKGIVHRDVKPANLFVTANERVKILDFGIARIVRDGAPDAGAESATAAAPTLAGAVLGTVGYMAPEQVRGEAVDHRADIFSFGAVFYEMVARRRAFQRDTVSGTLAAILDDQPPTWTGDGTSLSVRVIRLINRCLEKQPRARFQSARDLSLVLADEITDPSMPIAPASGPVTRRAVAVGAVIVALSAIAAWGWIGRDRRAGVDAAPVVFELNLPAGDRWGAGTELNAARPFAVSPDGRRFVYAVAHENISRLHFREIDAIDAPALPGTEGASQPFFSPDGSRVGFFAGGHLKTIAIESGVVRVICPAESGRGGAWGEDDVIVFSPTTSSPLMRVPASGGTPEPLTRLDTGSGEVSHRYPQVLSGGHGVIYAVTTGRNDQRIAAQRLAAADHITLVSDGVNPYFMPGSGQLVYADSSGELFAAPFDASRLSFSGPAVARHERPAWFGIFGTMGFSASANGTLIYVPFEPERRRLAIVSHAGTARTLPLPVQWYSGLRLAPNGQQAAVVIGDGINTGDIWLLDLQHANLVPFTRDRRSRGPAWSQDGKRLAFSSDRNGVRNVFVQPIAAGSSADQITSVDVQADASSWSPDGALVFHQIDPKTGTDVWMIRPGEKSPPLPLLRGPGAESQGRVSPDGRLLAFVSNQSGRPEVYLTTFPVVGPIGPVSQGLGANPRWAANGNELFFSREGQILSVRVQPGGVVSGAPQPAMPGGTSRTTDFDVFPDGSFIVITADGTPSAAPPLIVITGWAGRPVAAQKR